jgi:hypothetical protein
MAAEVFGDGAECGLDALAVQVDPDRALSLRDRKTLQARLLVHVYENQERYKGFFQATDVLQQAQQEPFLYEGGKWLSEPAAWLQQHQIKELIAQGLDRVSTLALMRTAPALLHLARTNPAQFAVVVSSMSVLSYLTQKGCNKLMEVSEIGTELGKEKLSTYFQSLNSDLTPEQALYLAETGITLIQGTGQVAANMFIATGGT